MPLDRLPVRHANRLRSLMLKVDRRADLRLGLSYGALKVDAPSGVTLALGIFQRHEITLAVALFVLVGRGPMLHQFALGQHLVGAGR